MLRTLSTRFTFFTRTNTPRRALHAGERDADCHGRGHHHRGARPDCRERRHSRTLGLLASMYNIRLVIPQIALYYILTNLPYRIMLFVLLMRNLKYRVCMHSRICVYKASHFAPNQVSIAGPANVSIVDTAADGSTKETYTIEVTPCNPLCPP